jgi:hypothetical protein
MAATDKKAKSLPGQDNGGLAGKPQQINHDEIAMRAFECWQERGCPFGSPELDWKEAERDVQARSRGSRAAAASK